MNRKTWLTVGLSVLLGSGIASAAPVGATSVTEHGARVQIVRWGDQGGEQGEVESPRWGDQGGDQTDAGAPRT
jgi:hypothetical protein